MNCSNIQQNLLNGEETSEIKEHLEDCEECRIFKDSLEKFLTARPDMEQFDPPEKLDYEVKNEARLFIEKQMKAYNSPSNITPRLIPRLTSYFAAAACSALVAWLVIIALSQTNTNSGSIINKDSTNSLKNNTPSYIEWESIDMEEDFFNITTDIDINQVILFSTFAEDEGDNKEKENKEN